MTNKESENKLRIINQELRIVKCLLKMFTLYSERFIFNSFSPAHHRLHCNSYRHYLEFLLLQPEFPF